MDFQITTDTSESPEDCRHDTSSTALEESSTIPCDTQQLNQEAITDDDQEPSLRAVSMLNTYPETLPKSIMLTSGRPSRESVLQRLSEALLRRSLTKIDLSQRGLMPSDARLVKMALLQNAQLSSLKLGYNNLGDEGVSILSAGISQHFNLQSLDLGFNNISDIGCRVLCSSAPKQSRLHTLYLAGNLIGGDGAIAIADWIRRGSSLRKLYLTGNLLGSDGVSAISDAILDDEKRRNMGDYSCDYYTNEEKKMPNGTNFINTSSDSSSVSSGQALPPLALEQIFLGGSGIGPQGCYAITRLVQSSTRLRVLSLPNCEIGDDAVVLLSNSIKANRENLPLESLQLSFNKITCRGMESLSNAVWGSRTLKELLLDNNQISDRGIQQIAAVLPHVKTMEILNVGFNQIKAIGVKLLMKAVVDSTNITSVSVSGSSIDTSAAKAIAYALAYNTSLVNLSLVHCNIGNEGQRHIAAGIVSNSKTSLRDFSGFKVGPVVVSLGFPAALEHWNNSQILNFIHLMWQRNQALFSSTTISTDEEEKMMDPLNFLGDGLTKKAAPLEATIVVDVAKKAFAALIAEGYDVFSRPPEYNDPAESPLVYDGIMVESLSISPNAQEHQIYHHYYPQNSFESSVSNEGMLTKKTRSFIASPEIPKQKLSDPTRKKRIVEWLCSNIQHINKLAQSPFNSSELWKLHQHYFTPVVNESGGNITNSPSQSTSSCLTMSSVPEGFRECSNENATMTDLVGEPNNHAVMKTNNNPMSSLPMLKRKVSYRFLGDAALAVISTPIMDFRQLSTSSQPHNTVSLMIESGPSVPTMHPKTKKARRNRSRISFLPRVKAKLDSYLDVCHEKALITMRQLYYVEQAILAGQVNPTENPHSPPTHLYGDFAADAETIVVDML